MPKKAKNPHSRSKRTPPGKTLDDQELNRILFDLTPPVLRQTLSDPDWIDLARSLRQMDVSADFLTAYREAVQSRPDPILRRIRERRQGHLAPHLPSFASLLGRGAAIDSIAYPAEPPTRCPHDSMACCLLAPVSNAHNIHHFGISCCVLI